MSARIDIQADDRASPILEAISSDQGMRGRMVRHLGPQLYAAGQRVVGNAVKYRFTGKGPFPPVRNRLGVVTGRLRRSIRATRPQMNAGTGDVSISMGSNVSYFAVHEFGFTGKVQVRGHIRRRLPAAAFRRGKLTKASQSAIVAARRTEELSGKARRGRVGASQVRPHSRRVKFLARAPLGTEIRSARGRFQFRTAQKRAVEATLREVNP